MSTLIAPHPISLDVRLDGFVTHLPGVRAALLASLDGRPIASSASDRDPDSTAAIVASSRGLGERLADLCGDGELQEIVVRSDAGYVVLYAAGDAGVLTVLTDRGANLALLHLQARELVADLISEFALPGTHQDDLR